jgi:hypothetical protein
MKTLIQLMNDVGRNTRLSDGTTFTTVNQDADAVFIVQMINEAKRMVEGEQQWDVLITSTEFLSVISTATYDLSNAGVISSGNVANDRSQLVMDANGLINFWDITVPNENRMVRRTRDWVESQQAVNPDTQSTFPINYAFYPFGDGMTISFPYTITTPRTYRMQLYTPQVELALDVDVLVAPWRPVVLAATALAAEERGEELGMSASTWWERYNSALAEAMVINMFSARDATLHAT